MARTDPQVNLRIPEDLKERLQEASVQNNRSLTAEIVARLQASFPRAIPTRDEARSLEPLINTLAALPSSNYQPGDLMRATMDRLAEEFAEKIVSVILQERGLAPPEKKD